MNNKIDLNRIVLEELCIRCFYLIYSLEQDTFECDKYRIKLDGKVESCPGFMPIAEGLDQLITKMKANDDLPESI